MGPLPAGKNRFAHPWSSTEAECEHGTRLRHLSPGAKGWKVLLEVKGDNLYRIAENACASLT